MEPEVCGLAIDASDMQVAATVATSSEEYGLGRPSFLASGSAELHLT